MNGIKIDSSLLIYAIIIALIILISGFVIKKILEKKYKEEMILINYKAYKIGMLAIVIFSFIGSIIKKDYIYAMVFLIIFLLYLIRKIKDLFNHKE